MILSPERRAPALRDYTVPRPAELEFQAPARPPSVAEIDAGARIDNYVLAKDGAGVDHGACCNHRPQTYFRCGCNDCARMNNGAKAKAKRPCCGRQAQPSRTIANRNDYFAHTLF